MIKQIVVVIVLLPLATLAGFLGGSLAAARTYPDSNKAPIPSIIKAKRFEVVDNSGNVVAHCPSAQQLTA